MDQNSEQSRNSLLNAVLRVSTMINALQELDVLLEKIIDIAVEAVRAERGFVLLEDENGTPSVQTARNMSEQNIEHVTNYSNSVIRKVLQTGETILSYDTHSDGRFEEMSSVIMYNIRSIACVPLKIKERPIGVIYLDSVEQRSGFTEDSKPFLTAFANQAAIAIENAQLYQKLQEENRQLRREVKKNNDFAGIIGKSQKMKQVFDLIQNVVDSDVTVLIQGESGTGKELVARALHYQGIRRDKPFVALFCGSLPESLLESELFGHKKGAFTGAATSKLGLFEAANHGTLFLDEIGDITPKLQTQLLRVLQEGEIKRIGENEVRKIDVRIIAATNKDLQKEIKDGHFREDLFYRLNVIDIHLPPLRERGEDIALLSQHFLTKYARKYNKVIHGFSPDAIESMASYHWPGNVRELENKIEKAVVLSKGALIGPEIIRLPKTNGQAELSTSGTLQEIVQNVVEQTMNETGGNVTHAAARLGVSRRFIQLKLKELNYEKN